MSCEDFSSLQRLLRVTAYILRAVNCFQAKGKSDPILTLTPQETTTAEKLWITHAQKDLVLPEMSIWPISRCQGIVEMWWPATECQHSFCSQASSPAPQKAHLNCPHSSRCSSTCGSQWSERDPYRTPTKVLGCRRSEPHPSYTRQMQETQRSSICWSTTSTSARIQNQGRPGFHLYRRGFCRPPCLFEKDLQWQQKGVDLFIHLLSHPSHPFGHCT